MERWRATPEMREWMTERIPMCGSIEYALDMFEQEWGHRPTKNSVYQWSHKAGKHFGSDLPKERDTMATRRIMWKSEPELMQWMREHDHGQPVSNLRADFKRDNGFDITRSQIGIWRQSYGNPSRRPRYYLDSKRKPIGTRRATKGGVLVKVREMADKPGSKDCWEYEHHIAWRKAYGDIPEGHQLMFLDGDPTNSDIDNLFCISKKQIPIINQIGWHDRETLEFALAQATLKTAIQDAYMHEQTCGVCGRKFKPWVRGKRSASQTCKECLDAGKKARGERKPKGEAVCAVCGKPFTKYAKRQVRCRECIDACPRHGAKQQKKSRDRRLANA